MIMSYQRWLSILALTGATLVSRKANAETVMQPIIFPDPLEEVVPGRKVNANLFINAVKMADKKIHFTVEGVDCEIVPGSCNLRLALPPKTEVEKISQYGWRKVPGMIWGTNNEKVLLYPNEGYQRAVRIIEILGKGAAAQATGPMFAMKKADDMIRIILTGKTKDEVYREKMRKAVLNMSLLEIPEYTPKNPLAPRKYFCSRGYDFELSRDPELGFGVLSLTVADKSHRTFSINDLIVSFDDIPKRAMRPVTGRKAGGIEDLLLQNDPELKLVKKWEVLPVTEYSMPTSLAELEIYVLRTRKKDLDSKEKKDVLKYIGKTMQKMCEIKHPGMMPHQGGSFYVLEIDRDFLSYYISISPHTIKRWRNQKKRPNPKEIQPIRDKVNSMKKAAEDRGQIYMEETERFFRELSNLR